MKDTFMNRLVFASVVTILMFGGVALIVLLPKLLA
jgi:hypothetical protein